jgi:multidrug efflux pump subunit AcrB
MVTTTEKPTPPATVLAAFFGYLVSTVTAFASAGILLGAKQKIVDALRTSNAQSGGKLTDQQIDQTATVGQAIGIAVVVAIALLYLLLAFKLKAGRNWARVLLTIITLLQVAALVTAEGTPVGYVSCAVAVVALVLSYFPASNRYVARVKGAR